MGLARRSIHRGQALVETLLILPLVLLLALGAFDLGRAVVAHLALQQATQEGALYAAHVPDPESDVVDRVKASSDSGWVADATVTVSCTAEPAPGTVTVRSDYALDLVTPFVRDLFGGTIGISVEIAATNFSGAC